MSGARWIAAVLVAGWLAETLASKDADVEAGIAAYEAGEYDEALQRFDAARERRPERPELSFNRGLVLLAQEDVESARTAFETATEAEDANVRASALYELGNMALDAQEYDAAIEAYIDSLKARPDHSNAKWNLELALSLKQKQEEEQEEQEQEEEQNEDEQNEDEQNEDEQNEDEQNEDEQNEDEQNEDEQEQNEDEQEQNEDEQEQNEDEQEQNEDEQEQNEDEPEQDEQQPSPPQAIDQMDVQKALEQLDEQDPFTLDRPVGGYVQPEKDW